MKVPAVLERLLDRPAVVVIRDVLEIYGRAPGGLLANGLAFATLFAVVPIALVTLGEMLHGAYWRGWGPSRTMEQWAFIGTLEIVIPTAAMASLAASFFSDRRTSGKPLEWNDAWIAATAVTCQCPLVTHDSDFTGLEGLYVISDHRAFRAGPACTIYSTQQTHWLESAA